MPTPEPESLIAALQATVHRVLDRLAGDLAALGLTHGEINALFHLDRSSAATVASLLAATGQRPSTLTGVIDRLERRGLLEREINPRDRRSFVLRLTEAGGAAAEDVRGAFATLERASLDGLPAGAREGFVATLGAFDAAAGEPRRR